MMEILRTPDERFVGLPDFPFAADYVEVKDRRTGQAVRIGAVDEGPRSAPPVLLMHGEPSWSYLYRKMIAHLLPLGHRCVAPDLVGFGRSDKPASVDDYTYERHVAWMSDWLLAKDLTAITLFCQDWGGLIGLRLLAAFPERFARVIVANTGLPVGAGSSPAFERWAELSQTIPVFTAGRIVDGGSVRQLSEAEIAAYEAPYPEERYKAGARIFPTLVPVRPDQASVEENKAAWEVLSRFDKPFLTAFSDQDPITRGGDAIFQGRVPGAKGLPHVTIEGGGHFLQEDKPEELADLIHRFAAG